MPGLLVSLFWIVPHDHCTAPSNGGKGACSTWAPDPESHFSPTGYAQPLAYNSTESLEFSFSVVQFMGFFPTHLWISMTLQGTSVEIPLQVQELLRWEERKVDDEQTDGNDHQKMPHFFWKLF